MFERTERVRELLGRRGTLGPPVGARGLGSGSRLPAPAATPPARSRTQEVSNRRVQEVAVTVRRISSKWATARR
jgi:hypothetical protein